MERYVAPMSGTIRATDRRRIRGQLVVAETRREIFEAAHRLFVEHGYVRTTIPAIAEEAGVAVQTIYNTIGSKRAVFEGVLAEIRRGPDNPRTLAETLGERMRGEPDAADIIEVFVDWLVGAQARLVPLVTAAHEAAAVSPDAAEIEYTFLKTGIACCQIPVDELERRGVLRAGLDPRDAAVTLWSLGNPHTYHLLVSHQGWTSERYRRWLLDAMGTVLREPSPARR
jgi:AcrR family transcriptional regulator